ncbi:unnamed protein product [Ilex paraguariensis]|uniref:F-box associated beta-propeller type 3 domain-containing protein n=1 Tax=Ilex paraguariensis TaxID=185542 RepID=A0ABC8SQ76_9AQUA
MDNLFMKTQEKHSHVNSDHAHAHGLCIQLPDDIIFSELPVKFLMRFRCVSQSWCFFFTRNDPSCVDLHLSRLGGTKLLICARNSHLQRQCLLLADLEGGGIGRITQSLTITCEIYYIGMFENINGLVCWHHIGGFIEWIICTYICNPSTREIMKLPIAPPITNTTYVSYHFGFDPYSKGFKLLNIRVSLNYACFWILTLGDNSWRHIYPALPFDFADGALPWLFRLKNCAMKVIVVFDLRDEEFHVIQLPTMNIFPDADMVVLLQVDGHLILVTPCEEIWRLEDYENKVWMEETVTNSTPFQYWCLWRGGNVFAMPAGKDLQMLSSLVENGSRHHRHLEALYYHPEQRSLLKVQIPELSERGFSFIDGVMSQTESIQNLLFQRAINK